MLRRLPTAMPIRPSFTRSTRFRAPNVDVRQGLQAGDPEGRCQGLARLARTADRRISRAQPSAHALPATRIQGAVPARARAASRSSPAATIRALPQVAAALRAVGYLNAPPAQQPARRTVAANSSPTRNRRIFADLVAAVKKLQGEFGFKQDGVIGGDTLDALNAGPGYRARQLAIAMERLRWLPRNPPPTRIDVNTAASFLDYWRDGQHVDHRKVVDGEADKPTPQLQAPIVRLVAKPTWTVPERHRREGAREEEPGWLSENKFVDEGRPVCPAVGAEELARPGQVRHAGRRSDLSPRHAGEGAVRLCPTAIAATAASASRMPCSSRPRSRSRKACSIKFQQAMQKDDESFIKLPKPKSRSGCSTKPLFGMARNVQFRPDVYGWDENIAKALGLAPGPPQQDPAARKQRRCRAITAEGAGPSRRPHPPPRGERAR